MILFSLLFPSPIHPRARCRYVTTTLTTSRSRSLHTALRTIFIHVRCKLPGSNKTNISSQSIEQQSVDIPELPLDGCVWEVSAVRSHRKHRQRNRKQRAKLPDNRIRIISFHPAALCAVMLVGHWRLCLSVNTYSLALSAHSLRCVKLEYGSIQEKIALRSLGVNGSGA